MCDVDQRELVCRSISFGPVDPYSNYLNSTEYFPHLIDGSVAATKNAYASGGSCFNSMPDNGYYAAHTVPTAPDWGWKWDNAARTYIPPPGGDPYGMVWNGNNFVQGPIPDNPPADHPPQNPDGTQPPPGDGDVGRPGHPVGDRLHGLFERLRAKHAERKAHRDARQDERRD